MPFEFVPQSDYLLATCKGECRGDEAPSFSSLLRDQMTATGMKQVIIQCGDCSEMGIAFLRDLAQGYRAVKETNGVMRLVNVKETIRENIKKNGLDRILICKMSMRGALVDLGLVKAKEFDVNLINPFLTATQKVLKIQCALEALPQKPYVKKPGDPMLLGDLSGIIGITSETFDGTLAISFPERIFLKIASGMLGQKYDSIVPEIVDLAGELSNIILGQAKLELAAMGYRINQAIPSCVWGKDHKIKHFGGGLCIVLPFNTSEGTFHTEIISNSRAAPSGASSAPGDGGKLRAANGK